MIFVPLPGVVIEMGLLQIIHYDWLLLFIYVPLWKNMFSHVWLILVIVHFTQVTLLNSQSIKCPMP